MHIRKFSRAKHQIHYRDIIPTIHFMALTRFQLTSSSHKYRRRGKDPMNVLRKILAGSRYLIIISVLGTLVGSIIVLGYAVTVVGVLITVFFNHIVF